MCVQCYILGTFYMPSPMFLVSGPHHTCKTTWISTKLVVATMRWLCRGQMRRPRVVGELTPCGGDVKQKKSGGRSIQQNQVLPTFPSKWLFLVTRQWPIFSIFWCPHSSLPASFSSDVNHTSLRLKFLIKYWHPCLFPRNPMSRQLTFNYLKQNGTHAVHMHQTSFDVQVIIFPINWC